MDTLEATDTDYVEMENCKEYEHVVRFIFNIPTTVDFKSANTLATVHS